jgi:voltage-gated sodium channel
MFIGSVIMGMVDSTEEMILEKKRQIKKERKKSIAHEIERLTNVNHARNMDRATKRIVRLINLVFTGRSLTKSRLRNYHGKSWFNTFESLWEKLNHYTHIYYIQCVDLCADISENSEFKNFITLNIIIASVQIGLTTDVELSKQYDFVLLPLDYIILSFFTLEIFVKVVAEGLSPWTYFNSNWNKFDFFIVATSYVSNSADLATGNLLMMLRLLRLLRIFKLMRAYPKLQVIVTAIFNSLSSVLYIGLIIFIFLYFYAIIGMSLFANIDPWHYTYLHSALITLFQGITFDNWIPIVLTEAYGCFAPVWFYQSQYPEICDSSLSGNFTLAFIYFVSFNIIGGFILLSLFIGVINVYMDVTRRDLHLEQLVEMKLKQVIDDNELDSFTVNLYREVFHMIDFSKSGYLGSDELRFGLVIAGNHLSENEFDELRSKVDKNNDNKIDFSEFLSFALDLKNQRDPIRLRMKHKKETRHQEYSMVNTRSKTDEDFATQNSSELKSEDGRDPMGCCTSFMLKLYRSRSPQVSPNVTPPRESLIGGASQKVFPSPEIVSSSPSSPVRMASQKKMVSWRDSFDDKKLEEIFPAEHLSTPQPVESALSPSAKSPAVQNVRRRILSNILTSALKSTSSPTVAPNCNSSSITASTLKSDTELSIRTPSPSYRQKEELLKKALNDIQNAVTEKDNQALQMAVDAAKELKSLITL